MKRLNATSTYFIFSSLIALANTIMFTTYAVYYVQTVGMSPMQLVLVGTALEATILLLEVPTGVVADTYSRRLSVIIGIFILGVAWIIEGALPLYAAIITAEIIRGVGETFLSGATDAWLADEVGEDQVGKLYVRAGQLGRVVGLIATGISVWLASIALNLPMLIGGAIYVVLGVILVLWMPEHGFARRAPGDTRKDRAPFHAMARTFRDGAGVVRRSQTLTLLLIVSLCVGIASEGFDRLWEAHLLLNFTFPTIGNFGPVAWFGVLGVIFNLTSFVATEVFRGRLEAISRTPRATARALLVLEGCTVLSIVGFGLAGSFGLALAALVVKVIIGAFSGPLYSTWIVQNTEARVRATAMSMISQTNAIGQTVGGPGIGALGNVSLRAAMVAAGLLISPMLLVYARVLRQTRTSATDDAVIAAQEA